MAKIIWQVNSNFDSFSKMKQKMKKYFFSVRHENKVLRISKTKVWALELILPNFYLRKALVRRAIFASNIAIKRYCYKKISNKAIFFVKILLLHFKIFSKYRDLYLIDPKQYFQFTRQRKKISFYRNIAYLFIAILLVEIARLTRAYNGYFFLFLTIRLCFLWQMNFFAYDLTLKLNRENRKIKAN